MSKARDLADFISTGSILSDGTIESTEISGVTADATEINKLDGLTADTTELNTLDGVTATTAELNKLAGTTATTSDFDKLSNVTASATELNYMTGATSSIQSQLDNISVTSGSLTKSFTSGESATITLAQSITPAPVVSVTKEISQTGQSSKGAWDVDATASNYDLHNTAYSTTLTPSNASADGTFTLGTGSFASTDVGKQIEGNGGVAILTATDGSYSIVTNFTDTSAIASGSWSMRGIKSDGDTNGLKITGSANTADIGGGSYDSISRTLKTGTNDFYGHAWKPDGTVLFVVSDASERMFQFNLSTAWDISTTTEFSFQSITESVAVNDPRDIVMNSAGTKIAIVDNFSGRVRQYNMSSPFTATSMSYAANYDFQEASQPFGIAAKPDWTKIFIGDASTNRIYEYTNGTGSGFSLTYTNNYLDISSQSTNGANMLDFNSDGTVLIVAGNNKVVYKYNLSTAYDISTASYASESLSVSSQEGYTLGGISFKEDDLKLFTTGHSNNMYQYSTGLLAVPTSQYHIGVTNTNGQIDSSFWTDINSMTADQSLGDGEAYYAVSTDDRTTWSVAKGSDGVRPIVRDNAGTWQYNNDQGTTVGYDIASGTYEQQLDVTTHVGEPQSHYFKTDGTVLYVNDNTNDTMYVWNLSTAWDLTTATYSTSWNHAINEPAGLYFSNDGTKVYITNNSNSMYHYSLSTAWDVSTASSVTSISPNHGGNIGGLKFKPDGTKFYICEASSNSQVHEWGLSTAWDLTTRTYNGALTPSQDVGYEGIAFNADGTQIFLCSDNSNTIYRYDMTTAYDITSATYSGVNLSAGIQNNSQGPNDITFENNGQYMFLLGKFSTPKGVQRYSTGSVNFGTSTAWTDATTNDEFYALQQALGATSVNRMDKTQLDAVADGSHFTLGNTLDLMIALKQDTASASLPTSDGVTINYDAAALNQGAVLGTDYDFDFPANNKVRITSNAAQNLKIRVV